MFVTFWPLCTDALARSKPLTCAEFRKYSCVEKFVRVCALVPDCLSHQFCCIRSSAPLRRRGHMQPTGLEDCAILIVEDEPMIAMDLAQAFERAGAGIAVTSSLRHALILVEDQNLSAAVLDHVLSDGDSSPLCRRLEERGLPFVVYSGLGKLGGPWLSERR